MGPVSWRTSSSFCSHQVHTIILMDLETGEGVPDCETGELPCICQRDQETGEAENNNLYIPHLKRHFRIPKSYHNQHIEFLDETLIAHKCIKRRTTPPMTSDFCPAVLFLLPTVFFCPSSLIILGVIEVSIHIWTHKKNKVLENSTLCYKSPLHMLVSEFCAKCREERTMDKIKQLQDIRTNRFRLSYDYMKRIVT